MRLLSLVRPAALAVALFGSVSVAQAAPITYEISGIASGTVGASIFTDALVEVTVTGDTANIVSLGSAFANPSSAMSVTIAGVGTAAVTNPSAIYSSATPISFEPGFPVLPYVIIATLDNPPALDSFTGLAVLGSNALLDYDLQTSIGPIMASPGGVGYPGSLNTTLGDLSFTSDVSPTTQATFSATAAPAPVPEPTTLLLLGSGIAAIAGRARFRPRS